MVSLIAVEQKRAINNDGEMAQVVERLLSMHEVPGSSPGFSNVLLFCVWWQDGVVFCSLQ